MWIMLVQIAASHSVVLPPSACGRGHVAGSEETSNANGGVILV